MPAPTVEGTIAPPPLEAAAASSSLSSDELGATLNEPVSKTIMRDLRMVAAKVRIVLSYSVPQETAIKELRNWDLWGPLLLCLVLSMILSMNAPEDQKSLVFSSVFVIIWVGAAVVTANAQLLGGTISFFQSVCVLGYCVCPLVLASLACLVSTSGLFRTPLVLFTFLWSCRAAQVFFGEQVPSNRKALAAFPVGLFYVLLAWMIFVS